MASKSTTRRALMDALWPGGIPPDAAGFEADETANIRPWMRTIATAVETEIDRRVDVDLALLVTYVQNNPGLTKAQILTAVQQRLYRT